LTIKIGIGTLFDNTRKTYEHILREIVGERYHIQTFNFSNYTKTELDVNILLISTPFMITVLKNYIGPDIKMILINRTFTKESYNILKKIPSGTKALLVNNCADVTFETISLIYSLGFDLELIPFYPGKSIDKNINIAIPKSPLATR
jgi:hypothetical protein